MSMADVHVEAHTGFKKATYRRPNPRQLLLDIMDALPNGPTERWRDEFWNRANDEPEYLKAVVAWWLDNNINSATLARKSEREQRRARAETEAKAEIKERFAILLLDQQTPLGKPLRHCTGAECKTLGGWYIALAAKVGLRREVGERMSETALQSFLASYKAKRA